MSEEETRISERIAYETGLVAGRLERFLSASFPSASGSTSGSREFLRAWYTTAVSGRPPEEDQGSIRGRGPRDEPHPIDRLIDGLCLSESEAQLLVLAGLAEEHEGFAAVLRSLHPASEPWASAGLAAQLLFPGTKRHELRGLLEGGPAVRGGALRLVGEGPIFERTMRLPEKLWSALHGLPAWPSAVELYERKPHPRGLEEWFAHPAARRAIAAIARNEPCTVLVRGEGEEALLWRALALTRKAGREAVGIRLPHQPGSELRDLIRVHAVARHLVPVLQAAEMETQGTVDVASLADFPGPVVVSAHFAGVKLRGDRAVLVVRAEPLGVQARHTMWEDLLPGPAGQAAFLAARYPMEPANADLVAADLAMLERVEGRRATIEDLSACVRERAGTRLSGAVQLVRPIAAWDDLVLPQGRLDQLREAVNRLLQQARVLDEWGFLKGRRGGRGVRLLFSGPPGTGKSLAAEVMANALDVDLLVVDLSRVVSKWIGETEKNLSAVFDGAERAQAVLCFDEADALFGKRTEVSDAHDRYANLETAYLLQRLERFDGLAVLTTNFKQNIDAAFMRRLEFAVEFDEPDREQRLRLWRGHIPKDAPLAPEVNLGELAALYPVVGGYIRNATVAAAFAAAGDGRIITRRHLGSAMRREYEKAGRAFPGMPAGTTS